MRTLCIRIDDSLFDSLKSLCVHHGDMAYIVRTVLQDYLSKVEKKDIKKGVKSERGSGVRTE